MHRFFSFAVTCCLFASQAIHSQERRIQDLDIAELRRGVLIEAGMQFGGSSSLQGMRIQSHLPNPGRESSLGGSFAMGWRETYWRFGGTAAYDAFHTTADQILLSTSTMLGREELVQKGVDVSLLSRISVLGETELAIPFFKMFAVTLGAGLGRHWILPGEYWTSVSEHNSPPGWIGSVLLGLEATPEKGNTQLRLGWERFSYRMSGKDGIRHDLMDDRFVFSMRAGFTVLFPPKKSQERSGPSRMNDQRLDSSATDTAKGSRTPESILKVIRLHVGTFRRVYESHLRSNPNLGGKITMKFVIASSGDIVEAEIVGSNLGEKSLELDLLELAKKMKFDPIEKGKTTITYSFVLDKQ